MTKLGLWKKAVFLIAAMCGWVLVFGAFGVQAALGTGDMTSTFEITNVSYSDSAGTELYVIETDSGKGYFGGRGIVFKFRTVLSAKALKRLSFKAFFFSFCGAQFLTL